ncbi:MULTISPECIES: ArgE/DapE family deacylase [Rhizobium]|uniref:ArgE/DapE family deacylase n=1 Tax=Rhizobium TaxID=379 RepID=UPI000BBDB1B0|nr:MULTISPECIES: ArgE/DapE family deacylase [Rhizobium]PCK83258.1 acetylornithine deacetylase [Rhizobium sophoriradicis]PDS72118.1 acetylornithine deacetylase [Rhizobium sp. L43]ULJ82396.1 ArgE/DapE family deacylase [Rhizobium sp. C104]
MDRTAILHAVDALFDRELEFLTELVRQPSTRGAEQSAQDFVERELSGLGFEVDRWQIDVKEIANMPGFSPVIGNYENAVNVVGSLRSRTSSGRSLILNGHIDVVPTGPLDMWDRAPFDPHIDGDWMYGRGAGDMKAGLTSNLFAIDALKHLGLRPAADVFFQSVVEEECTGNGALACLHRGYRADAALIPEPFAEKLVSSQVGVIWFQVRLKGLPTHVAYAGSGANAIEAAIPLFEALHRLERRMNAPECRHHDYVGHSHALNLNIGKIEGGDWASSVPAWCVFDVRMGVFPGQRLDEVRHMIEETIFDAARNHPFLAENGPEVVYNGFAAEGYSFKDDKSAAARAALAALDRAHSLVVGKPLEHEAITATTDARFFGLYADTPALVYGPRAEAIHGFNERVDLDSVRRVTQSTALFIADWCGLEEV